MDKNQELQETISIITNKLNPLYKKEIQALDELISAEKLADKLDENVVLNLRGTGLNEEEFKNLDITNEVKGEFSLNLNYTINDRINSIINIDETTLAVAGSRGVYLYNYFKNAVYYFFPTTYNISAISKIDNKRIVFGEGDNKVTIFDLEKKKEIIEVKSFDDGICSCYDFKKDNLTLSLNRPFIPNNDSLLYKHAWYVNKKNFKLEPYFKFPDRFEFDEEEPNKIVLK